MTEIERLRKLREQVKSALSNPVRFTERAVNALHLIDAAIAEAEREQAGASPIEHPTFPYERPVEHDSPPPAVLSAAQGMTPAGSPSVFSWGP